MRRRHGRNPARGEPVLTQVASRIDERWFTDRLADSHLSRRQLAKLMGVDPASVHRLLKGKRAMRMDEATEIARLLSLSVADVLEHAGMDVSGSGRTVPLAGYIDGDGEAHLDWDAKGEQLPAPVDLPARAVAVQMQTAASPLDAMDGWTLFTTLPDGIAADAIGRLCLVGLHGKGVVLLRFVRRGYSKGRFNLVYPGLGDLRDAALDWAVPIFHIRP